MRIAFLCKRQYMAKDVIADRYARLYELPFQLARLGHEVLGVCLSYQGHAEGHWQHEAAPGSLRWESHTLGRSLAPRLMSYPWRLLARLRAFEPDVVVGASDIPHVALTAWLSRRLGVRYAVDLYDNFESFGQARMPGMVPVLRRATRDAALVTTTSEALAHYVQDRYGTRGRVVAMPSTVDKAVFRPQSAAACRQALGLPADARLIGTAGGLYGDKGVGTLYAAWEQVRTAVPDAHLVIAGPFRNDVPPPRGPRVHYLGQLSHADTATLFSALDLGVVYLRDSPFGRYCFPQKAYEMMACDLPLVAARVGVMPELLRMAPDALYAPDDADDLARCLMAQLQQPRPLAVDIPDWPKAVAAIEPHLREIAGSQ